MKVSRESFPSDLIALRVPVVLSFAKGIYISTTIGSLDTAFKHLIIVIINKIMSATYIKMIRHYRLKY